MKKVIFAIAVIVIAFCAGIIFKLPNLYKLVVGIPLALIVVGMGLKGKIFSGILLALFGVVLVFGGAALQKNFTNGFPVKEVQASAGSSFVVDAQNVDYPIPYSPPIQEAKSAQESSPSVAGQPIAEANSGNCEFYGRYPAKVESWCALIEAEAKDHGMDPLLIASLILVESGGQAQPGSTVQNIGGVEYHTSSSGAVGLMQVMPSDGMSAGFQCINGPCFGNRPTTAQLIDPTFNVDYGVRMLAGLVEKRGDIREALKSYGPNPDDLYWAYGSYYWYADKILGIRNGL